MAWPYNDSSGIEALMPRHAFEIRAILVEPIRGAGGCVSTLSLLCRRPVEICGQKD